MINNTEFMGYILYLCALIRITYLLFIILNFLFLKESIAIHAGTAPAWANTAEKVQQTKFSVSKQAFAIFKSVAAKADEGFFTEDEDENTVFAKKYVLQASYFLIFAFAFVVCFLYGSFKYRLPLCVHLSYLSSSKYLIQRDLRI